MPILQSVEAFCAKLFGEVETVVDNPVVAPFVPMLEKELVTLAEDFASAHGVDPMAAQKLITDALAIATKHAAPAVPVAEPVAEPAPAPVATQEAAQ